MIVCLAITACALAPASAGASAVRPSVSLVASPARISLVGTARQTIRVANTGASAVVVDIARAGFALDLRGRPRVATRPAAPWLHVRPLRLAIAPGREASLTVRTAPSPRAEPGDHGALVLLTTERRPGRALAIRMRLGVVVVLRVPGRIVRRLVPLRIHVRRAGRVRVLVLTLANLGNVTETVDRRCVSVALVRRGRVLARLRPARRDLLPRTRGIVELRYRGAVRGRVRAVVPRTAGLVCPRRPGRSFVVRL